MGKEVSGPTADRWRGHVFAGAAGGTLAGLLIAYLESIFLLLTVGPFWVDVPFLLKALLLYGLAGGGGGIVCASFFYFVFFRRRPLRLIRPWVFFFAFLSACGLGLEAVFYMMDIHTFRKIGGEWTTLAYFVFFAGIALSALLGWAILGTCRSLFDGKTRKRSRNGTLAFLLLFLLFLAARAFRVRQAAPLHGPAGNGDQASIIMLLVDSLRPDHLSAYGYPLPTSPGIDRLAREGMLFRHCYAVSNWTVPTHTSIFTGLYPSAHGNYSMYSSLDPSIPTLPQHLAGRGYRTASLFDNKLLGRRYGLMRGFQTALGVDNEHKTSLTISRLWDRLRGRRSMSGTILRVAEQWITYEPRRGQPFFLFVNFLDAHIPYRPQQPYIKDFLRSLPAGEVNVAQARRFTTGDYISKKEANELSQRLTAADWRWLERFYDSNIRLIDDRIRLFLDRLRAKGYLENTVVIVTSDHGEFFGERGIGGHLHSSMHNAGLHVPLILWFPRRLAAGKVERPVSQLDLFPTILGLAGMSGAASGHGQGRDLFADPEDRALLAEFWDDIRRRFSRALFAAGFKLVIPASGKRELYDLETDAGEKFDLAQTRPEVADALARRLENLLRSMPLRRNREEPGKRKEMERLLKSLGYL